ncbi:MAG: Bacteriohemerythrin [uncultured Sulfurovum sp.]|uniref:Bacteriohemerythrin n=1 Tax=uncultured Sulfurovum sp. TaxID=269237 RepID=A0A6S6SXV7_9BACT|nr:MAG: Bacteriohemerythrin [uncultured Sulfurovum sp.]
MLIQAQDIQQVGNAMMNMLHEDELAIINDFYGAVKSKDIEKIDELFKTLLAEVESHFQTEEEMMKQSGYADMQMHKSDHDLMRKKLEKFHKRWEVLKGPKEVQGFLEKDFKKWYTGHVSKWDAQTAPHIA